MLVAEAAVGRLRVERMAENSERKKTKEQQVFNQAQGDETSSMSTNTGSSTSLSSSGEEFRLDVSMLPKKSTLKGCSDAQIHWMGKYVAYVLKDYSKVLAKAEKAGGEGSSIRCYFSNISSKPHKDLVSSMKRYYDQSSDANKTRPSGAQLGELVEIVASLPSDQRSQLSNEAQKERLAVLMKTGKLVRLPVVERKMSSQFSDGSTASETVSEESEDSSDEEMVDTRQRGPMMSQEQEWEWAYLNKDPQQSSPVKSNHWFF